MQPHIILASASPRRIEMMRRHGYDPEICPAEIDETLPTGIGMRDAVLFLALKKALHAERRALKAGRHGSILLAADTVVYKDAILGKPADRQDARRMLQAIRGTDHFVATGVALLAADTTQRLALCDVTRVFCKAYTDAEIEAYLDTGEPFDKAGAYAIQGAFRPYIDHWEGSYDNVVGFPWDRIEPHLRVFTASAADIPRR